MVVAGDEDLAKDQLRSQLREKVVVDRETVWSQMVSGHRSQGIFRSVEPQAEDTFQASGAGAPMRPGWLSAKAIIFFIALVVLVTTVQVQPFRRVEESNCLAMLVFCTILWATEVREDVPLQPRRLTHILGNTPVCHLASCTFTRGLSPSTADIGWRGSTDECGRRHEVSHDGPAVVRSLTLTRYIFSQMFSPTIMLLIGGFTIAAVLSKTRLDVMTATRILNAAGTKPSVVLLVLMLVATFASMWISNVAAPTLCYALVKVRLAV